MELLVVIAIIGILAALIFPAAGAIKKRATISKAQTEMDRVIVAIELYKEKLGAYPPDNPRLPALNPLYFELLGTRQPTPTLYETLDKAVQMPLGAFPRAFSGLDANNNVVPSGVSGFVNSDRPAGEETLAARTFLRGLQPGQFVDGLNNGVSNRLLTCTVQWPKNLPPLVPSFQPVEAGVYPNPWRYVSSNPTNNPGTYDLWVDLVVGGKTNRISNWRRQPLVVAN
jgi:type II secretory pathway pseudopilin PulG